MFEISEVQKKAAENAMNGVSVSHFLHAVLYCVGCAATFWILFVLLGAYQEVQMRKIDLGDALGMIGLAAFILICTGTLIHF